MGILDQFFGNKKNDSPSDKEDINWITLQQSGQLEEIAEKSNERLQLIFKHSTTCGISRMALQMFKKNFGLNEGQADLYFLDIHAHRPVSNAVAEYFKVRHQSPQLIAIRNGKVVAETSHGSIPDLELSGLV